MSSRLTGVFSGAPSSFQSGNSSFSGARFEYGAGEDVCADLGAFLDHADADFVTGFGGLLLQSAGGGQACRASADDDHVEFHVFAFHRFFSYSRLIVFSLLAGARRSPIRRKGRCLRCSSGDDGLHRFLLAAHYIYTTCAANTNVCLNLPQASKIKEARLEAGRFCRIDRIGCCGQDTSGFYARRRLIVGCRSTPKTWQKAGQLSTNPLW